MEWFLGTLLPSLEKRMNNPKYPNQAIITRNQFDVCCKYFHPVQCHGDYGRFTIWEFATADAHYQITFRGKYIFLTKTPNEEDPVHKARREAERYRIKIERIERTKRNPERLSQKIDSIQQKIAKLILSWEADKSEPDYDESDAEYYAEEIAKLKADLALYTA